MTERPGVWERAIPTRIICGAYVPDSGSLTQQNVPRRKSTDSNVQNRTDEAKTNLRGWRFLQPSYFNVGIDRAA